jgi:hypothetical protein
VRRATHPPRSPGTLNRQASGEIGERRHVCDWRPGGFILPWQGTEAAGIARAAGNAADVNAFGHFLVVVWTYITGSGGPDGTAAQLVNGLVELHLSQWADNRAASASGN